MLLAEKENSTGCRSFEVSTLTQFSIAEEQTAKDPSILPSEIERPSGSISGNFTLKASETERGSIQHDQLQPKVSGRMRAETRYKLLQKFDGVVVDIDGTTVRTNLFEDEADHPAVQADFDLDEISESDRNRVQEGARFVWTIGYTWIGSTKNRTSSLYFRRFPDWSMEEFTAAKERATELTSGISWE